MKQLRQFCGRVTAMLLCIMMLAGMTTQAHAQSAGTTLRVAFYPLDGFFEYDEQGKETGYGVELLNLISQYTGIQFTYVYADSWEDTQTMLLSGQADVRMPGTRPSSPSTVLSYTEHSIIDTYYALMTLKSRTELYYQDYEAFAGLKIGVCRVTYDSLELGEDQEGSYVNADNLVIYSTYGDCRDALASGEIDALISNVMDLEDDMKQLDRFHYESNYISMSLGNPYIEVINNSLAEISMQRPNFLSDLYKEWFLERVSVPLTKEETEYLASVDSLLFSFHDGQGYLSHTDEEGNFVGFYPAISKEICERLGVGYEETTLTTTQGQSASVCPDFYYDRVWAAQNDADITLGYFEAQYFEVTQKNRSLSSDSRKVAAVEGFRVTRDYVEYGYTSEEIIWCRDYEGCLEAVLSGQADVTYISSYAAEYYMKMYRFSNLTSSLTDYAHQVCFGVWHEDTGVLASILDKTISTFTSEEIQAILIETTSEQPEQDLFVEWMYEAPVRAVALLSLVGIALVTLAVTIFFTSRARKKNLALMEATRAKQAFLSRISHDMRTPMNAIIGYSYFGQTCEELPEAQENHKKIYQAGQYLLQLINDSLELSRMETQRSRLQLEPHSYEEFADGLSNILQPRAQEKNIDFSINSTMGKTRYLMFDKIRLQQVFVNLLNNAIKFTPEGGRVSLDISGENQEDDTVLLTFRVSDNGIGMAEEYQRERLFKPFEQENLSADSSGSGLGLAIVKELVTTMGGSITCQSTKGEGTTFIVKLRSKAVEAPSKPEKSERTELVDLSGKRVLLCEDHPTNREIADRLLRRLGMEVETAENGQEGVERFCASPESYYDVILMDIRMPVMNGLEAARKIRGAQRADAKTVPIVALSANSLQEDVEASQQAGMNEHLAKPIDPRKLAQTLRKLL